MGREAEYTTDLNEITTGNVKHAIIVPNMICPRLRTVGKSAFNNWSSSQCLLRIEINAECTLTCEFAKQLKEKMDEQARSGIK